MELIAKLGIDWKLLIAQIINFGILLFILYKFVYGPVLKMLHDRQTRIAKGLEDAKKGENLLRQIEEIEKQRQSETEKKIGDMLAKASHDAEYVKTEILKEAQAQAEDFLTRAKLQAEEMKRNLLQEVRQEVSKLIIVASAKILEREFSETDQKRLTEAVIREIETT